MRDYKFVGPTKPGPNRAIRNDMPPPKGGGHQTGKIVDPVVQKKMGRTQPGEGLQIDGLTDDDNQSTIGTRYVPPDTNSDVGPNHVVEYINTIWAVYDKSGNLLLGPLPGNSFWQGLGGDCQNTDDGDPIVMYDREADRWFVSQFAVEGPFSQCVAVSTTGDPTGSYFQYQFFFSNTDFPDYPKFGIWPDAYYMTANVFGNTFYGAAHALNRAKILVGDPTAEDIFFQIFYGAIAEGGVLPSNWTDPSSPPPAGSPDYFMTYDIQPNPDPCNGACLLIWQFHVDFTTPGNSTFTGPAVLPVPAFITPVCGSNRDQCVPQLSSPELLETLSQDLMYPLPYRNFGDHEALGATHTVGDGTGIAQVRWYEVRDPGGTPTLFQSGTYAPDSTHRWMPSIAFDKVGNMALNYSRSDSTLHPQAAITGRLVTDDPGTMGAEDIWYAGAGSQINSFNRWGDYTAIFTDPNDDCTFWGINEYYATTTDFAFRTRIGSFVFPSCLGPTGTLEGTVTDTSSNPIQGATVTASPSTSPNHQANQPNTATTTTDINGHYSFLLPVGTYDMTANKFGYTGDAANGVQVLDGGDTVQNFILTPNSTQIVNGTVKDGSGAGWPLYARIDITGPNGFPGATLFTDPVSGYYSIQLPAGFTYTFTVTSQIPGYNVLVMDVFVPVPPGAPQGGAPNDPPAFVQNFSLLVDAGVCVAPGYVPGAPVGLLSEDFGGGVIPPGWTTIANSGNPWTVQTSDPCGFFGNDTGGSGPFAVSNSNCDGTITDDNELRTPSLDMSAFGGSILVFKTEYVNLGDTADVDVSTDGGTTWNNVWRRTQSVFGPDTETVILPNTGNQASVMVRWHNYNAFFAWWWQVDDVSIQGATCNFTSGGLVVGNVSDANTGDGLNGATVKNMPDGASSKTLATPDDPAVPDGFYAVFAGSGPQPFEATDGKYQPNDKSTNVIPNSTVRLDFALAAGLLSYAPSSLTSKVLPGDTDTQEFDFTNSGSADATFTINEVNHSQLTHSNAGHFANPHDGKRNALRFPPHWHPQGVYGTKNIPPPYNQPHNLPHGGGGTIIVSYPVSFSFPNGLPYGAMLNSDASNIWISNIGQGFAGDQTDRLLLLDGTETGDKINLQNQPGLVLDGAYNPNTGMLWQSLPDFFGGTELCVFEIDPVAMVLTGNSICPNVNTPQEGLAYDVVSDTYWSGSFFDTLITHFDGTGATIDSGNTGLIISGLAFNPDTRHLFVLQQTQPDIVVVDPDNNYNILTSYSIGTGLPPNESGGLEIDCDAHLWAVDQLGANPVIVVVSGDEGSNPCSGGDIPWFSEDPNTGIVPAGGGRPHPHGVRTAGVGTNPFPVQGTFDSANLYPGLRQAQLKFKTDTPYSLPAMPLNFTVRFLDVLLDEPPGTDIYENYIYAAAGANIMHGCSYFNFCPHDNVTRADMAGYIFRSVHGPFAPPPAYTGIFQDVFYNDYNADYIQGVFNDGITVGCSTTPPLYCPTQPIPRAQMAVFIEKGVRGSTFVPPACVGLFQDVTCPPTPDDPYGDWVELLFNDGITAGCSTNPPLFCPLQNIPNEQMAVFVVKAFGFPVLP